MGVMPDNLDLCDAAIIRILFGLLLRQSISALTLG